MLLRSCSSASRTLQIQTSFAFVRPRLLHTRTAFRPRASPYFALVAATFALSPFSTSSLTMAPIEVNGGAAADKPSTTNKVVIIGSVS